MLLIIRQILGLKGNQQQSGALTGEKGRLKINFEPASHEMFGCAQKQVFRYKLIQSTVKQLAFSK